MAEEQSVIVVSTSEPLLQVVEENNSSGSTSRTTIGSTAAVGLQSILEISWNLVHIIVSVTMLFSTREEHPTNPIRLWIIVCVIQCLIDVVLIVIGNSWNGRLCNAMVSSSWWIIGLCWVASGGSFLMHSDPHLYWNVESVAAPARVGVAPFLSLAIINSHYMYCKSHCLAPFVHTTF